MQEDSKTFQIRLEEQTELNNRRYQQALAKEQEYERGRQVLMQKEAEITKINQELRKLREKR